VFVENKYKRWYFALIEQAKERQTVDDYTERHHVVPKSLGGNHLHENLARLTFREHFIVHWLLTKFTTGDAKRKMQYALHRMCHAKSAAYISGWQYAVAKRGRIDAGITDDAKRKLSETQKARGPTKKLLDHLARLNARFKAEGGTHWKYAQAHQTKLTEKQLKGLEAGRLSGKKRTITPKFQAHINRLVELNKRPKTPAQVRQLIAIQQAPKTEKQKEAFRRSHRLPRSAKQMAQIKSIQGLRWAKHRELQMIEDQKCSRTPTP
jgi:hypothetical protein